MTFPDMVTVAWFFGLVVLNAIPAFLPSRGSNISLFDAGMFAAYLVVIAWGAVRIVEGKQTGWTLVITAAGCFAWRLYWLFLEYERKLRGQVTQKRPAAGSFGGHMRVVVLLIVALIAVSLLVWDWIELDLPLNDLPRRPVG